MTLRSVAAVLEHFDDITPIEALPDVPEDVEVPVKPIGYLSPDEAARKVADAEERTRAECETRAEMILSAALEDQARRFDDQLAAARREWAEVQAERLTAQISSVSEVLETRIAAAAARALRPFLIDKVREEAVRDMRVALEKIIANTSQSVIEVSGPQDLLDALSREIDGTAISLSLRADTSCELRAVADDTVIETQMQEWVSRISSPLGPNP